MIATEAFYSKLVFLVEGVSEELFYKALAEKLSIDLDRLNISIINVDGVGFKPYISLLKSLEIQFVIRTDNDIFKIQGREAYRFSGIKRCIDYYKRFFEKCDELDELLNVSEDKLEGFASLIPPQENKEVAQKISLMLEKYDIFIANIDLENDLFSALSEEQKNNTKYSFDQNFIANFQKRKATNMFNFLQDCPNLLENLEKYDLSKPLLRCQEIMDGSS